MTRRSGMTLIEVLVAIFIMAIGLIALLTLFPIGMLRIAQGIRDQRSAESAVCAHANSILYDIRNDPQVITDGVVADFFVNPTMPKTLPDANPWGESYPVFVDPIGWGASPSPDWVSGAPGYLRRRPVAFTGGAPVNIYKAFTLWDDINFDGTTSPGTPQTVANVVLRDTRFSWGYLLRRPQTRDRSIVDCTIVVFDQRSLSLTGKLQLEEHAYTTYYNPANSTITIDWTNNVQPPLKAGDWILDSTINNAAVTTPCAAHAYFYRVAAVEDLGVQTVGGVAGRVVMRYEVQNPLRGFNTAMGMTDPTFGYQGTSIVIRGVAEVFEKGPVRLP